MLRPFCQMNIKLVAFVYREAAKKPKQLLVQTAVKHQQLVCIFTLVNIDFESKQKKFFLKWNFIPIDF